MLELGLACDGGKDSLSMAAKAGGETVMAPGNLVVSAYVGVPDVTKVVTPDLVPGKEGGVLLHVDLGRGRRRLGGSALAQSLSQLGDEAPDVLAADVAGAWKGVQAAIDAGLIRAGHDISDGGIVTTLLEMAFAGELVFCLFFFCVGAFFFGRDERVGATARAALSLSFLFSSLSFLLSSQGDQERGRHTHQQQGGCIRVTRVPINKNK
jgi:hypothetical protein